MQTAPSQNAASDLAAGLCRRFEGLYLRPYLCPAGVATVGFGATRYVDGRPVLLTDSPITRDAAERMLVLQIDRTYLPAVRALCPGVDGPRLAALTDFAFNLGVGALRASTLRRRVLASDWDAVPGELRRWVRGGGRVLPGLVRRREAEIALIEGAGTVGP